MTKTFQTETGLLLRFIFDAKIRNMIAEILINLVAQFIWWIATVFVVLIALLVFYIKDKRRLMNFLGLDEANEKRLTIFFTTFFASRRALTKDGNQTEFFGNVHPNVEFDTTTKILSWLNKSFEPDSKFQQLANSILGTRVFINAKSDEDFDPELDLSGTIITIGGDAGNRVSKDQFENNSNSIFKFEGTNVKILKGRSRGKKISPEKIVDIQMNCDLGVLQKVTDPKTNTVFIVAAGLGIVGTIGTVNYLIRNWKKLPNKDFGLVIQFFPGLMATERAFTIVKVEGANYKTTINKRSGVVIQ